MNPIYTAEVRYQDYVIRTNRSSTFAIVLALLLIIPALITALVMIVAVGVLQADLPPVPLFTGISSTGDTAYTLGTLALVTMNLAHYLVVAMISSGLAIFSVQREQRNGTWDLLVLTRQTARSIAFGKIRASLWVIRRDIAIVTTLRLGLIAFMLDFVRPAYPFAAYNVGQFLLIALFTVAWTVFDMVLAVSTAIASTLAPQGRSVLLPATLLARGIVVFGGVWWLARIIDALYNDSSSPQYAITGLIGLAVFALIAGFSLKIAEIAAQFAHATPHHISQTVSQSAPPSQGQTVSHIPNLSQR